jgi:chromosome segregation ATPase
LSAKLDEFQRKYQEASTRADHLEETTQELLEDFNQKLPKLKQVMVKCQDYDFIVKDLKDREAQLQQVEAEYTRLKSQYADALSKNYRLQTGQEPPNPITTTVVDFVEDKYREIVASLQAKNTQTEELLKLKVGGLERERERLKTMVIEANSERMAVLDKFNDFSALEQFYRDNYDRFTRMSLEFADAQHRLTEAYKTIDQLERENSQALAHEAQLRSGQQALGLQLGKSQDEIKALQGRLHQKDEDLRAQVLEKAKWKVIFEEETATYQGLQKRIDDLERQNSELTEACLKDNAQPLRHQVEELVLQRVKTSEDYQSSTLALQTRLSEALEELELSRTECSRVKLALTQVPEETWTYASEIEALRTIIASLERQLEEQRSAAPQAADMLLQEQCLLQQEVLEMTKADLESMKMLQTASALGQQHLQQENTWLREQLNTVLAELKGNKGEIQDNQESLRLAIDQNTALQKKVAVLEQKSIDQIQEFKSLVSSIEVDHVHKVPSGSDKGAQAEELPFSSLSCLRSSVGELDQFVRTLNENTDLRATNCELQSQLARSVSGDQLQRLVRVSARALTLLK